MPIELSFEVRALGQEEFHDVDRTMMGLAFGLHNRMGRFFDEAVYQSEMETEASRSGLNVRRETEIRVVHRDFSKTYFADLVVNAGCIYEMKVVSALNGEHQNQLLNYLLLASMAHGKLINFRPKSVESRFVSTRLDHAARTDFVIDTGRWIDACGNCGIVIETLAELLADWGAFLELNLYREALIHFHATQDTGFQPIDVISDGRVTGQKKMCVLNEGVAWHFSAIREHFQSYEVHLRRCISHTSLTAMQWGNFNGRSIAITTLMNPTPSPNK